MTTVASIMLNPVPMMLANLNRTSGALRLTVPQPGPGIPFEHLSLSVRAVEGPQRKSHDCAEKSHRTTK